MNTTVTRLVAARQALMDGAGLLRKQAEAVAAAETIDHKAETEAAVAAAVKQIPTINEATVREMFEDLSAVGLAKAAETEAAVKKILADPNVLCDVARNVGATVVTKVATSEKAEQRTEAEPPGKLVAKTASAAKATPSMSQRFAEVSQKIELKRAAAGRR